MTEGTTTDDGVELSDDYRDSLVRGLTDLLSDPPEGPDPLPVTDPEPVVRSMLTENTGRHLLDSGGESNRNWKQNRENPPWERPRRFVRDGYVEENIYDRLVRECDRDQTAVALEVALHAYGYRGPGEGDGWNECFMSFTEWLATESAPYQRRMLAEWGVPDHAIDDVVGWARGLRDPSPVSHNTYGSEFGSTTQDFQVHTFDGLWCEYIVIRAHGGADIRGGYAAPRVFTVFDGAPSVDRGEYSFVCETCGWREAESVVGYDNDDLLYQDARVDPWDLTEWATDGETDELDELEDPELVGKALERAHELTDGSDGRAGYSGALFHDCDTEHDDQIGVVTFS